jgi:hypothetical protein
MMTSQGVPALDWTHVIHQPTHVSSFDKKAQTMFALFRLRESPCPACLIGQTEEDDEVREKGEEEEDVCVCDMWDPFVSERSFIRSHNRYTKRAFAFPAAGFAKAVFSKVTTQQLLQKPQLNQTHP